MISNIPASEVEEIRNKINTTYEDNLHFSQVFEL
jgi:hypothetical protein